MFSSANMTRIVKVQSIKNHIVQIDFVTNGILICVLVDFEQKSLKFENIYQITACEGGDFDVDIQIFGQHMIFWDKILPVRLQRLHPWNVINYSFVAKQ
jgi:hypothetical protein